MKSKTRTEHILTVMRILAWVAFIGLLIETGTLLISYGISWKNPEAAKDLNRGLNLYNLSQLNFWYYTMAVSFLVAISGMKAFVLSLTIKTLSSVNLINPFKVEVARILEQIGYVLLGISIVAVINNAFTAWLAKRVGELHLEIATREFLLMAGLVFIISQVFKRGVEIQSENDLTV